MTMLSPNEKRESIFEPELYFKKVMLWVCWDIKAAVDHAVLNGNKIFNVGKYFVN